MSALPLRAGCGPANQIAPTYESQMCRVFATRASRRTHLHPPSRLAGLPQRTQPDPLCDIERALPDAIGIVLTRRGAEVPQ